MHVPPPGYDDATVIPFERMKALIEQVEHTLSLCKEQIPAGIMEVLEKDLHMLQEAGAEITGEPLMVIQDLQEHFAHFKNHPIKENLDSLYSDLERLKSSIS